MDISRYRNLSKLFKIELNINMGQHIYIFFPEMNGEDNYFCGYSLNDICLYLKQKKLGFTVGRCSNLCTLIRA